MTLEVAGFWGLAVVLLASSLGVVLAPNLFHAVLYLAVALVTTGGIFLLLDAPLLFGAQLLLYAGGVVTIVVFAIMLTERIVAQRLRQSVRYAFNAAVAAAAVFVGVLLFVGQSSFRAARPPVAGDSVRLLGEALVTRFALSFELLAVLLVAAMLGAVYLARTDD